MNKKKRLTFDITDEDFEERRKQDDHDFFGSKYTPKTHGEVQMLPIKVETEEISCTESEMIEEELIKLGYSGKHILIKDGPISRVIPLNINGERENI